MMCIVDLPSRDYKISDRIVKQKTAGMMVGGGMLFAYERGEC